jgi:hypothetical protein
VRGLDSLRDAVGQLAATGESGPADLATGRTSTPGSRCYRHFVEPGSPLPPMRTPARLRAFDKLSDNMLAKLGFAVFTPRERGPRRLGIRGAEVTPT